MNGRTKKSKKQKLVEDFIKRVDPYAIPAPIAFDLRGYAAFLKEHNLHGNIPADIMNKFVKR